MPLKDLLKKKDKIAEKPSPETPVTLPQASEFKFIRTDTHTEEKIDPPTFDGDSDLPDASNTSPESVTKKRFNPFRKSTGASPSDGSPVSTELKKISQRLSLTKNRSASGSSTNLPEDLPNIQDAYSDRGDQQEKEAQWEERATRLATKSPKLAEGFPIAEVNKLSLKDGNSPARSQSRPRSVSDAESDVNIQEAIRLHEAGQLEEATEMFRKLAESGNVLSQVLYGLSLRHGWGCTPNPEKAVTYLSAAASNSATIEAEALRAGMKKGGAAKGELVLAIFELANCFRYGWGVQIDKVAARQYYETAANLGDTDAMNEAAWCYLEGFGGKKDKYKAAQLLRLAENNGSKTLGNSWIWKEKYNPK